MPPERATQIKESMKSNYGGNIHTRIGLSASNISQPKYFCFCPQCLQEDEEKYGEFYWHRIHQLSCVLVCPTHNISLQNSTLLFQQLNQHHYQVANRKNCISDNVVKKYSPQN
ncbi:TniQ family protein [Cyanobacterium stanieri LEGE 03274]|uniref:TniQ family protein n=1 Tax=Cyanobacterium stanieri LEGE 03274 TaxID=1828756 RepID=A0ABR9V144_9CHRO|nr:TniQ family protein [Cyanobacterium stanieri LEGE 03274]